jgi:hypothetical protein
VSDKIVRKYLKAKNPKEAHFPGVGLRDLTQSDWASIPKSIRKDVDASGFYEVVSEEPDNKPEPAQGEGKEK